MVYRQQYTTISKAFGFVHSSVALTQSRPSNSIYHKKKFIETTVIMNYLKDAVQICLYFRVMIRICPYLFAVVIVFCPQINTDKYGLKV